MNAQTVERWPIGGVELVPVEMLHVDTSYQRPLDEKRAESYGTNWSWEKANTLIVNVRPGGNLYVVDGQHRFAAAHVAGVKAVLCFFIQIPIADEPLAFVQYQTLRKSVKPVDNHRASVRGGDPEAVAIDNVVRNHGLVVRMTGGPRDFHAIGEARQIYQRGGVPHLSEVMDVAHRTWGYDRMAFSVRIIGGLSIILATYDDRTLARDALVQKLQDYTPRQILGIAKDMRAYADSTVSTANGSVAHAILFIYNKGRRNRIDPSEIARGRGRRISATIRAARQPEEGA